MIKGIEFPGNYQHVTWNEVNYLDLLRVKVAIC